MENIALYSLTGVLSIVSFVLIGWVLYLKYKPKYTREKYAFVALFAFMSLATLGVTSVLYQTPWTAVIAVISYFTNTTLPAPSNPTWSEKLLIVIFVSYIIWMIQRNFNQWNGEISVNHYDQKKRRESVWFVSEGLREIKRKRKGIELKIYTPKDYENKISAFDVPSDSLAWRIQAIELLTLRWHGYYRFETDNDEGWHEKAHCWIGKNIKQNKTTSVLCCRQLPKKNEIKDFIDYIRSLENNIDQCEFIIVTQEGRGEKTLALDTDLKIKQYSEEWLLNDLVDFEDYFLDLKKRVEFDYLPDSNLVLPDIYVPSFIKNENDGKVDKSLEEYLNDWLSEPGQRQLAILGEYGQGKSTGALMYSYNLVYKSIEKPTRIPILLELRGKSPKTLQPLELLSVWASNYRIDAKALMKLQQAGRLLLIFEGFDEMAEVSDAEARFSHFNSLWRFSYPNAKILITGRPNFFLDDKELKALLGIHQSTATGAYVEALHLQPFSLSQIKESLRSITEQTRREIIQLAVDDRKFLEIVSRPSLLYIVNQLWDKWGLTERKQDINSAMVIGLFIQHIYKRQTEKVRDGRHFMILNESEREYFTDGIAAYMIKEELPNQITLPQFNLIIEKLYDVIPDEVSDYGSALNANSTKPLKIRLRDNDDPLEAVQMDIRTYGILVKDLSRSNAFKFPHKSFLEFLFANFIVKRLMDTDNPSAAAISTITKAGSDDLLYIPESLEFAGELLQQDDKIKSIFSCKDDLQRYIFNVLLRTKYRIASTDLFHKFLILYSAYNSGNELLFKNIIRKIGVVKFKRRIIVLFLIAIISVISTVYLHHAYGEDFRNFMPQFYGIISKLLQMLILIPALLVFVFGPYTAFDKNSQKVPLWFLFSVILGVKSRDLERIYGKFVMYGCALLVENYNAEHLISKYKYLDDEDI
jgi:hypothetical protein